MSTIGINLRKLSTSAQPRTFPYPTALKLILYPQRLQGEIGRTISDVQKRDGQTDKQTKKNSTFLAIPAAGEIRAPPNLAM